MKDKLLSGNQSYSFGAANLQSQNSASLPRLKESEQVPLEDSKQTSGLKSKKDTSKKNTAKKKTSVSREKEK